MVRDQGVAGSNPVAPTNSLGREKEKGTRFTERFLAGDGARGRRVLVAAEDLGSGRQAAPGLPFVFSSPMARMAQPDPSSPLVSSAGPASLEVRVTGRVQGVGFRYFTLEITR